MPRPPAAPQQAQGQKQERAFLKKALCGQRPSAGSGAAKNFYEYGQRAPKRRSDPSPVMPAKAGIHDFLPFPRQNIRHQAGFECFLIATEWVIVYQFQPTTGRC
jgi:hypothetical protein